MSVDSAVVRSNIVDVPVMFIVSLRLGSGVEYVPAAIEYINVLSSAASLTVELVVNTGTSVDFSLMLVEFLSLMVLMLSDTTGTNVEFCDVEPKGCVLFVALCCVTVLDDNMCVVVDVRPALEDLVKFTAGLSSSVEFDSKARVDVSTLQVIVLKGCRSLALLLFLILFMLV